MTTLDELRRANLQEQRRSADSQTPTPDAPAVVKNREVELAPEPPQTPSAQTLFSEAIKDSALTTAHAPVSQNGHTQLAKDKKEAAIVERVHAALARKMVYPTGVKATVDMPPELFWRLKRYCRDHNNATLRQVFLDVMIAYLDEEGY